MVKLHTSTRHSVAFTLLFTLLAVLGSTAGVMIWQKLTEPMQPIIIEMGDRYQVRWGNRFRPCVYERLKEATSDETLEFVTIVGIEYSLSEEAQKRLLLQGRAILNAYLYPRMFKEARAERWRAIFILFI